MLLPIFLLLTRFNILSCSSPFDLRFIKHNEGPIIIGSEFEVCRAIGVKREFIEPAAMEVETVGKADTSVSGKTDTRNEAKPVASVPQATTNNTAMLPSKPSPIKRARSSSETFVLTPNVSAANIIENEMRTCNFHKEKRERIVLALELIAANDIDTFLQVEADLLKAFKVSNVGYIKMGGAKNYLLKMMILFGADKFITRYASAIYALDIDMDVIKYLISTKPLDTVLNVLFGFRSLDFTSEMLQEIADLIEARHPHMDYFRRVAVAMLRNKDLFYWSGRILSSQSELEAFKVIGSEIRNQKPSTYEFFAKLAFKRSDLYVQCSDDEKFAFIQAIIVMDNLEMFEGILHLDPNIVNYVHEERYNIRGLIQSSLLDTCIKLKATKCSACLLEIAPELIEPGTFVRAIETQNMEILDAMITSNAQLEMPIEYVDPVDGKSKSYTLIQYAFLIRCDKALSYLVSKLGVVRVSTQIYAVWRTQEAILRHVMQGGLSSVMVSILIDVLGLDASTQITVGTMSCSLGVYLQHLRLIKK